MDDTGTAPISHVNVWPLGGELLVTWRGGGDVSVFVSDDPLDAGTDVRSPDAPGSVTVERRGRPYVHLFDPGVGFTVTAERVVELGGVRNFRDLGGYPTVDGSETRWGRVFRSGRLDEASDADLAVMEQLGITTVFDLRTAGEVDRQPDRVPAGAEWVHLPMSSSVALHKGLLERILDGDLTSYTMIDMAEGYLRMLRAFADDVATIVRAAAAGEPILVHCTAGKDRTGLAAMALLGVAGVGEGHLLDDYELSGRHQPPGITDQFAAELVRAGRDPDRYDLSAMLGAPRPVLRMTLEGIADEWGDLHGYLGSLGLTDDERSAARANLRWVPI